MCFVPLVTLPIPLGVAFSKPGTLQVTCTHVCTCRLLAAGLCVQKLKMQQEFTHDGKFVRIRFREEI